MLAFTPYARQRRRLSPGGPQFGLRPLATADWLTTSDDHAARLAHTADQMATHPELVFQAMPGSEAAQAEALAMIRSHLGDQSRIAPCAPGQQAPLDAAARLVEEDLCLLQLLEGGYRLTAASVACPSYWRLADKLGKELVDIHDPVPALRARIGDRMRRFFHQLPPERVFMRGNWFIHASNALFRLPEDAQPPSAAEPMALRRLFLRCERQTLRRLPRTGAVLFTIRVYVDPLAELAKHPALAADALAALRDDWAAAVKLREVQAWRAPLLRWLADAAAARA